MDSKELLIGRAAEPEVQRLIRAEIESRPGVDALLELLTMHMGPDGLIVAARVALNDELGADEAEDLADDVDSALSEKLPLHLNVFIDPTQTRQAPPTRSPANCARPWARPGKGRCHWCRSAIRTSARILRKVRALRKKMGAIARPNHSDARNLRDDQRSLATWSRVPGTRSGH